jgi:hypothetical protein
LIKEIKQIIRNLRQIGREKILERIKAFQNNEHMPNDIISNILKSCSKKIIFKMKKKKTNL